MAGWGLPVLFALAYAAAVAVDFGTIIHAIYSDSDTAIAPVIGHLMGSAPPGSRVVLGNHAWYEEYLFLRLTSGLPGYRQLWEIAPLLWSLAGRRAAGVDGCAGPRRQGCRWWSSRRSSAWAPSGGSRSSPSTGMA